MNTRFARHILRGYRPSGEDDDEREVRAALKVAVRTPALETEFRNQLAFDRALAARLDTTLSGDLAESLQEAAVRLEGRHFRRFTFRDPAMLAVGLAFLILVGLMIWIFMGKMNSFSGMQEAVEMALQGDNARPEQFEAIETNAGSLTDWFVMKDFDGFAMPRGMEGAPVIGVRTFKYDDVPVAVAAIAKPKSLCYVFEANPFGISLSKGEWKIVEYGDRNKRALAITQLGNMAFVIALREGDKAALQKYIGSLGAAP
jgi:hypothetical protein